MPLLMDSCSRLSIIWRRGAPEPDRGAFDRPSVSLGAGEPASDSLHVCERFRGCLFGLAEGLEGSASEPRRDREGSSSGGDMADVERVAG